MEPGTAQRRCEILIYKWSSRCGFLYCSLQKSAAHLHHRFVRVHKLNGSMDSGYTALQIWWEEHHIQSISKCQYNVYFSGTICLQGEATTIEMIIRQLQMGDSKTYHGCHFLLHSSSDASSPRAPSTPLQLCGVGQGAWEGQEVAWTG